MKESVFGFEHSKAVFSSFLSFFFQHNNVISSSFKDNTIWPTNALFIFKIENYFFFLKKLYLPFIDDEEERRSG